MAAYFKLLCRWVLPVIRLPATGNFGGSITLWWCGQNCIDLAPYIDDAPYRALPLTTGNESGHDWGNLLTQWNALEKAHSYALLSRRVGVVIMLLALAWGYGLCGSNIKTARVNLCRMNKLLLMRAFPSFSCIRRCPIAMSLN